MPSGRIHHFWWKRFRWLALTGAALFALLDLAIGAGFLAGYWLGKYVEPDLDHRNFTGSEYRAMRELKFIGAILVGYFQPYAYLLPHRHFLSHTPIISTAIRFVYLFWWVGILWVKSDNIILLNVMLGIFYGLCMSDTVHWMLDFEKQIKEKTIWITKILR